jgi:hypothetical protein
MTRLGLDAARSAWLGTRAAALALAAGLGGCGNNQSSTPLPDALAIVSGDGQVGLPGSTLPESLVVQLVDITGAPVANYPLEWRLTLRDGKVEVRAPLTDAQGRAAARWTLSTTAGAQGLLVIATPAIKRQLSAIASMTAPTAFQIDGGNGQTGPVSDTLPVDPTVVVLDINGRPVKGVTVTWAVTGGGGRIDQVSTLTDLEGVAAVRWVLGSVPGPQQLKASVRGFPALVFSATATSP